MESYVFYRSFHEAFASLSDEDYGRIMRLITEYALNSVDPQIEEPMLKMAFQLIRPQIDANARRREHGLLGGRPRKEETVPGSSIEDKKKDEKAEDSEFKPKEKKSAKFQKPTVEEVDAYIKERHFSFSAEKFIDYYESKGWVIGKSPMKNWKAACNTWQRNNQGFTKANEVSRDSENMDEYENFFKKKEGN